MENFHLPSKSLRFFDVIKLSHSLWRKMFKQIMWLAFLCALLTVIPSRVLVAYKIGHGWGWFTFLLILALLGLVAEAGVYAKLHADTVLKKSISSAQAFGLGLKRLWAIIVASVLFILLLVLVSLLLISPFLLARAFWPMYANVFDIICVALLLGASFYLFINLVLYIPLIIVDHLGPLKALKTSFNLVMHGWWQTTFLVVVLVSIFSMFEQAIAKIPFVSVQIILAFLWAGIYFSYYNTLLFTQLYHLKARVKVAR